MNLAHSVAQAITTKESEVLLTLRCVSAQRAVSRSAK
jgi:hypothetical protein